MDKRILIVLLLIGVLFIGGCVDQGIGDIISFVRSNPEVQEFLDEHPNAEITVTLWSSDYISENLDKINEKCLPAIDVNKDYYKVDISEGDLEITIWVRAKKREVVCIVKKGFETTTTTSSTTSTIEESNTSEYFNYYCALWNETNCEEDYSYDKVPAPICYFYNMMIGIDPAKVSQESCIYDAVATACNCTAFYGGKKTIIGFSKVQVDTWKVDAINDDLYLIFENRAGKQINITSMDIGGTATNTSILLSEGAKSTSFETVNCPSITAGDAYRWDVVVSYYLVGYKGTMLTSSGSLYGTA